FKQHLDAGRIKVLAITGAARSTQLPDIPTIAESGVPGYEATTWNGVAAPAKTPPAIIAAVNRELVRLLATPEVSGIFLKQGAQPQGSTPEALGAKIRTEINQWIALVKTIGLQLE